LQLFGKVKLTVATPGAWGPPDTPSAKSKALAFTHFGGKCIWQCVVEEISCITTILHAWQ